MFVKFEAMGTVEIHGARRIEGTYDGKRLYKIDWSFYMREGQKKARVHKSNVIKAMCVQEACNRLYQEEVQYLHFTTVDNISIWDPFTETFNPIFDEEAEED